MYKNLVKVSAVLLVCMFGFCACSTQTSNDCTKNAEENATNANQFPDGTEIDSWFKNIETPSLSSLGKKIVVSNLVPNNSSDDVVAQNTKNIQQAIDDASSKDGGVIYISGNTYYSGALFFKPKVNLYIEEGATLKGTDEISFYPVQETRIEGQTCQYYSAFINADKCDNFTIAGKGEIDGNGHKAWKHFWQRRVWNPDCTNKDEQRARLLYISNSNNVNISEVTLNNSMYWTAHIYKCDHIKFVNAKLISQLDEKPASTDCLDIDACTNVLVKNCYMHVNDDAVVMKGGKGAWADEDPTNGTNENIIVEDCRFGYCASIMTCGSESVHNKNIILRNCTVDNADKIFRLKFRADTPSNYEYMTVENITGTAKNFLYVGPYFQFMDLGGRTDKPISLGDHLTMRNCKLDVETYYHVEINDDLYLLTNFNVNNNDIKYKDIGNEALK